uniref:beta-N-acetylhexosaminidase n=4 Tax=Prevotella heparinolytica TaxID=28113 RepID=UPI00359F28F1
MKNLFKLAGVLAMAGVLSSCDNAKKTMADYRIVPLPQEITQSTDGSFELNRSVKIIYPENNEAMRRNAGYLAGYLKKATGTDYTVEAGTEEKGNILLALGLTSENPEAYKLQVTPDGVTIAGASEAAVFYGMQTLRKSIPMEANSVPVLAAVEINDYPRFGYRGAHIDVARHFFTVDEMKTFIDMMALHNMNRLHWHLTEDQGWRLEIKKYPLLTEIGSKRKETVIGRNSGKYDGKPYEGFYTQEEAKDIVAYAAERYITVIPEIDLPGHMQAALASYPHLGCTGGPYEVWTQWGV